MIDQRKNNQLQLRDQIPHCLFLGNRRLGAKKKKKNRGTNLLGSEIITNDILEPFANALFGDGIQVASTQNGVNDPRILVAQLRRY